MADIVSLGNKLYPAELLYDIASKKPVSVMIIAKYGGDAEVSASWSVQTNEELSFKAMVAFHSVMAQAMHPDD